MKTILFAMLILSTAQAWAVEWRLYHESAQNGDKLYYDLESLHQDRNGFDVEIRLPQEAESKDILTLLSVDCVTDRFRFSNGRTVIGTATQSFAMPDIWSPIEQTTVAKLKRRYCAYWYESDDMHWQIFAEAPGMTYYQPEDRQPEPARYPTGFAVLIKGLGQERSFLAEISILCRKNQYLFKQLVVRNEKSGVITYHDEESLMPIEPASWPEILKTRHCTPAAETIAKPVEEAR